MSIELKAILAGFGGQGTLFAGKVIAYAGLIENAEVSWFPSYGPEMRGGTANCSVTLSADPIGSPLVLAPNALLAMNQPSYDKFVSDVSEGGVVVYDSSLVTPATLREDCDVVGIPAARIAQEESLDGLANIVLLGRLWSMTRFCERETLDTAIERCVPPRKAALIGKNKLAIELGIEA